MFELYRWGTDQQKPNAQDVLKSVFESGRWVRDKLLGDVIGRHYSTTSNACQNAYFDGLIPKWWRTFLYLWKKPGHGQFPFQFPPE